MLVTCLERSPDVGALSSGSDSGMNSKGSLVCSPDHPIHSPPQSTTTGATAVTKPPALQQSTSIITCAYLQVELQ
jgi:hypothetical protein